MILRQHHTKQNLDVNDPEAGQRVKRSPNPLRGWTGKMSRKEEGDRRTEP